MKALEIKGEFTKDGNILLPEEIKKEITPSTKIKVIIMYDNEEWDRLTAKQFFNGYSEKDAIYDKL